MILYAAIAVLLAVTVTGTAVILFGGEANRRAARLPAVRLSLLVLTVLAAAGIVWEETSLRAFASREGLSGIRGLIMRPVPLTNDHQFTPNGERYLNRAIKLPLAVTTSALLVAAIAASAALSSRGARRMIAAVWLHTLTVLGALLLYTASRLIEAIEIFI